MYTRQNASMSIYQKRSLPIQKSANKYYKSFCFFFINGFLWFNCDMLLFAYFRSCLQAMSLAFFVVVVYVCFRPCLQIMLCALVLLYWPLMSKPLYICICICRHLQIPANSVKTESVFQIIFLYATDTRRSIKTTTRADAYATHTKRSMNISQR